MDVEFLLENINSAALSFIPAIAGSSVVAFHGEMGAGKTTFIHAVCNGLGVTELVSSPTFSIINEYKAYDGKLIFHMDLYRINSVDEAIAAGVEECLYSGHLCLVEWPEKAALLFTENAVHCYLQTVGNNRRKLQIKL